MWRGVINAGRQSALLSLRLAATENCVTVPRNSTRVAYLAMLPHADDQPRGRCASIEYLRSAGGLSPAQTEVIPFRVEAHETVHEAMEEKFDTGTCEQSFRGAVVVQCACS